MRPTTIVGLNSRREKFADVGNRKFPSQKTNFDLANRNSVPKTENFDRLNREILVFNMNLKVSVTRVKFSVSRPAKLGHPVSPAYPATETQGKSRPAGAASSEPCFTGNAPSGDRHRY